MTLKFLKLTRPKARLLEPGQTLCEHGIHFQRLPNGDGRYSINIMVDGKRIHRVIGKESEGVTRAQAEQVITGFRTEARHQRLRLPKGRKLMLSFSDAATKYLERLAQKDGKDIPKKTYRLDKHLTPFFGQCPLNKLSTDEIERYKKARLAQSAKPATINRELAVLS